MSVATAVVPPVRGARRFSRPRRSERLLIACVLGGIGVFFLLTIRHGHNWGDDFAMYIMHARNIAHGLPYAQTGYLYNPHAAGVGPVAYPPVFPLLLSPVVALFGLNLTPMKVELVLIFVAALGAVWAIARRELPASWSAALVATIGLSPFMWDFKDQVLSDFPFLLFCSLTLLVAHSLFEREATPRRPALAGTLLGLVAYLAFGTRTVGIVLVPVLVVAFFLRRRPRCVRAGVAACLTFLVLAGLQTALVRGDASYLDQITPTWSSLSFNLHHYPTALASLWSGGRTGLALLWVLGAFALWGFVTRARHGVGVVELFTAAYLLPVLWWPAYQGLRFLIPWVPFFLFYAFVGVRAVAVRLGPRVPTIALVVLGLAFAPFYVTAYARAPYGSIPIGVEQPSSVALFRFVRTQTDPNAVFVFKRPRALALYGERRAARYDEPADSARLWTYIASINARYLILGSIDDAYWHAFVRAHARDLRMAYRNDDFIVYELSSKTPA